MNNNQVTISKIERQAIQSLRYCLGRRTSVTYDCKAFIRKYWQDFTSNTKILIVHELSTALKDHEEGLLKIWRQSDYEIWKGLYDWCTKRPIE